MVVFSSPTVGGGLTKSSWHPHFALSSIRAMCPSKVVMMTTFNIVQSAAPVLSINFFLLHIKFLLLLNLATSEI